MKQKGSWSIPKIQHLVLKLPEKMRKKIIAGHKASKVDNNIPQMMNVANVMHLI